MKFNLWFFYHEIGLVENHHTGNIYMNCTEINANKDYVVLYERVAVKRKFICKKRRLLAPNPLTIITFFHVLCYSNKRHRIYLKIIGDFSQGW